MREATYKELARLRELLSSEERECATCIHCAQEGSCLCNPSCQGHPKYPKWESALAILLHTVTTRNERCPICHTRFFFKYMYVEGKFSMYVSCSGCHASIAFPWKPGQRIAVGYGPPYQTNVYPAPSKEWKTKVIFGARPKLVYADDLDDDKAPLLVGRCWWKPWTWKYPKRVKAPEGHHWSEDRLDPGPSDPRHEEESEFCHECGEKICGLDLGAIVLTVEGGTGYYMVCGKCAKKVGGDEKKG